MPTLAPQSVDMILCDLPYGTTQCKWDSVIPFDALWANYRRVIKPGGAIVLTAAQPFTSALVMSNAKDFRYSWVWEKDNGTGFLNAKRQPLRKTEDVLVFSTPTAPPYNPVFTHGAKPYRAAHKINSTVYSSHSECVTESDGRRYPVNILRFPRDASKVHPTQKPVALFEYLIKTYTQPGAVILDNCAGSGTTGAAAINTGRNFVMIEREQKYVDIIKNRVFAELPCLFSEP